jgi:hypothetical protein
MQDMLAGEEREAAGCSRWTAEMSAFHTGTFSPLDGSLSGSEEVYTVDEHTFCNSFCCLRTFLVYYTRVNKILDQVHPDWLILQNFFRKVHVHVAIII